MRKIVYCEISVSKVLEKVMLPSTNFSFLFPLDHSYMLLGLAELF